jgi:CSLREA domain-containing protein
MVLMATLAQPTYANSYVVNSTNDSDDGTCDGSHCSLREAVSAANSNPGPDTITFHPSLSGQTIVITDTSSGITIQGANSISTTIDGSGVITLTYGETTAGISGIRIRSSGNVVKNVTIMGFSGYGVYIQGEAYTANQNLITNTTIISNSYYGVFIKQASGGEGQYNQVVNNVVYANGFFYDGGGWNYYPGIVIADGAHNEILDNYVGIDKGGAARPNGTDGLYLNGATTTTVRGNTISGNRRNGIAISGGAYGNVLAGNMIGVNPLGTAVVPNGTYYNRDGIQCFTTGGHDNTIGGLNPADANVIGGNRRAGVFFDGLNCYENRIFGNYIGTNSAGADLGNGDIAYGGDAGDAGIEIEGGARDNYIGFTSVGGTGRANVIRYNLYGIRISGFSGPPQGNQVISNTITTNDVHGVVNQLSHRNSITVTPPDGDNWIAHNDISNNLGMGVFNWGASPHIVSNTITNNTNFGIGNRVYFDEADHSQDLLSIPYISGNTLDNNGNDDIFSRDTAPLNRVTVHLDNEFGGPSIDARVSQRWFGAVEVISGTATVTDSTSLTVSISTYAAPRIPCPTGPCLGTTYAPANPTQGIWGPSTIDFVDIENPDGTTNWFELREYEVEQGGQVVTYSKMLVSVSGDRIGATVFSYDGISTTESVSPDYQLLFCEPTGILTNPAHSLCRYQLAQVVVQPPGDDWDNDGIPDDIEGSDDADGDGTPNFQDLDSDGDGIPDSVEGADDADGDGTPNFLDDDSDGDGIPDSEEGADDTDGDGTPNFLDDDSDNDGIPDEDEAVCTPGIGSGDPCDSDGDLTPDYIDYDSDNDGVGDAAEGDGDTDGDGTPNYRDTDSDDDGTPDGTDPDDDNDGIPDTDEGFDDGGNSDPSDDTSIDSDDDGLPDYLDPDSDDDTVPDWVEAGCSSQPTDNSTVCPSPDQDTDGDTTPDVLDTDSDNDGLLDGVEWYDGTGGDTFCDNTSWDSDGDTVINCEDNDVDDDGVLNFQDIDSDGDYTLDENESYPDTNDPPFNHGDVPAWIDPVFLMYLPLMMSNY